MRWIFMSLLVANIALFAYLWQGGAGDSQPLQQQAVAEGASLVLLSELPVTGGQSAADKSSLQGPVVRTAGSELCTLVGPFPALLRAEYFQEHLQALAIRATIRQLEVPGEPGYWVYQSPQPSRKAALRRLQELQAKGIDSFVIPKGELENGISFGLFTQEKGAHQRLAQVIEYGYEATIKKVERSAEEIWVSLPAAEAEKVAEAMWLELLNREEGLEMRQNFCPAVASE
ncbi:SPOR domain-containing protein [Pseudomaricurvus alcaniphilus]|uniref:SPOR domain-containing protein n=1 Tax=Pseudomaricurvus alcaniphilus TaxID=1166482 RepID=UPI00140D369D|nr:SPOR domain-containing protein [Pseudomaricurvus alcaniphilus]NHN36871.1 SPOR domain-containing protein [Pseudomaricurvus alcaniphilus]